MKRETFKIRTGSVLLLACFAGCSSPPPAAQAAQAAAPTGPPVETRDRNARTYEPAFAGQTRAAGIRDSVKLDVQVVASGLATPWAVELLPDGRFLVTEKEGNLRIVAADGKVSEPIAGMLPVAAGGQGGLLDVALDPGFATNRTIYFSYSEAREGGNGTNLAKAVLSESGGTASLTNVNVIFRIMPTFQSALHFGSRIAFGRDGKLFLTLGERSMPASRVQSQDLNSHFGKVIRINSDGTVPADNPFVGRANAKPEVWSYGHRNVQGATIDPATGKLWTVEHGPRGGDELNHPEPGKNYGWPVISYGIDYPGPPIGEGIQQQEGMEQPVYYWDPVIAPSGMIVYRGSMFPQWQGSILIAGLSSAKVVRLQMDGDKVVGEEWLLADRGSRFRDLQQGPDGAIYALTVQGELLRLRPAAQ
jgi:glucose/arabinose dehydrogenase